jgi:hypothetical protein
MRKRRRRRLRSSRVQVATWHPAPLAARLMKGNGHCSSRSFGQTSRVSGERRATSDEPSARAEGSRPTGRRNPLQPRGAACCILLRTLVRSRCRFLSTWSMSVDGRFGLAIPRQTATVSAMRVERFGVPLATHVHLQRQVLARHDRLGREAATPGARGEEWPPEIARHLWAR